MMLKIADSTMKHD